MMEEKLNEILAKDISEKASDYISTLNGLMLYLAVLHLKNLI